MKYVLGMVIALVASLAQGLEVPKEAKPYSLIRVKLNSGERCFVLSRDFTAVDVEKTSDGLVFTGPPGVYALLAFDGDSQSQTTVAITGDVPPGPDPGPGPGPSPDPDNITPSPKPAGLIPGQSYDEGTKLKRGKQCLAVAEALQAVADRIELQSLAVDGKKIYETPQKAVDDVGLELKKLGLTTVWQPYLKWFVGAASPFRTFVSLQQFLEDSALGLKRAGGQ